MYCHLAVYGYLIIPTPHLVECKPDEMKPIFLIRGRLRTTKCRHLTTITSTFILCLRRDKVTISVSFAIWDRFWDLTSFSQSFIEISKWKRMRIHVVASEECQTQGRILETRQHCDSRVSDNDYCLGSLHFGLYTRKGVLQTGTFPWKLLGELSSSQMNLDNNMRLISGY